MPIAACHSVCTFKKPIARGVYELGFTKPAGFAFRPGQFILLDVPLVGQNPHPPVEGRCPAASLIPRFPLRSPSAGFVGQAAREEGVGEPDVMQPRALSIASTPDEDDLLFIVKIVAGGRLGRWVAEVLREGTSVSFKGPFGNFVLDRPPQPSPAPRPVRPDRPCGRSGRPLQPLFCPAPDQGIGHGRRRERGQGNFLFIATGAGIAPFRPMALEAAAMYPDRRIDVVFGVWSEEDLFWAGTATDDPRRMDFEPNAFVHVTLAAPQDSWTGHRGFVQNVAPKIMKNDFAGVILYACGNHVMTAEVKKLALSEWGIEKEDVHVDEYV